MVEKEYCTSCKQEADHEVEYTTMANGAPWRKGKCLNCRCSRTLPKKGVDPQEAELFFGKHKGKKLKEVPTSYLEWLYENANLNHSMKTRVRAVIDTNKQNNVT